MNASTSSAPISAIGGSTISTSSVESSADRPRARRASASVVRSACSRLCAGSPLRPMSRSTIDTVAFNVARAPSRS
jgi:hypothetical protein